MSDFSSPEKVLSTIRQGEEAETYRAANRVKIQNMANGSPPLDEETAKKLKIRVNVNWQGLAVALADARRQCMTAFTGNGNFFKVTLPLAPDEFQSEWGAFITQQINRILNKSLDFFELHRSKWAAVVTHGIGPVAWMRNDNWLPDFVAIEDLRIPTDTKLSFKNLDWWAVRKFYTVFELIDEIDKEKDKTEKKWDKKAVSNILKNYKNLNSTFAPNSYDWDTNWEKLAELVKQDGGYYSSDAIPAIPLYHFYFKDFDDNGNEGIFMVIVPETGVVRDYGEEKFLWKSDRPVAKKREHLLHCQFGDISNKAPFLYHSVRSLGYLLYEPCFYDNLTMSRLVEHTHDNLNVWLRVTDPVDKARAQMQEFSNYGVLRTGVSIVPQSERHQIDADLTESVLAQLRQRKNDASSTYTQSLDTGTKKEQTAFETSVKLQQVNAMTSGLILTAGKYETYLDEEICRRFCNRETDNEDIKLFQKRCKQAGIPDQWMDVDMWDVEVVMPLGMGNPTLAEAKADQLMQIRAACDPTAQQEILHEKILVTTNDPRKAARWAPLGKGRGITDGARDAQAIFGTLMQGVPVPIREGLPVGDQVDALLPLYAGKIDQLTKRDNMATPEEAQGLAEVNAYLTKLVEQMAQDPAQKAKVKEYMDSIGKLFNEVKGLAQRGQQHAQEQNGNGGLTPEVQAKIHAIMATAAAKVKSTEIKDQQKQAHKEKGFIKEQRRKDADTFATIQRDAEKAKVQNRLKSMQE
jgi:hypothetical protein